jgi:hypothetical protein
MESNENSLIPKTEETQSILKSEDISILSNEDIEKIQYQLSSQADKVKRDGYFLLQTFIPSDGVEVRVLCGGPSKRVTGTKKPSFNLLCYFGAFDESMIHDKNASIENGKLKIPIKKKKDEVSVKETQYAILEPNKSYWVSFFTAECGTFDGLTAGILKNLTVSAVVNPETKQSTIYINCFTVVEDDTFASDGNMFGTISRSTIWNNKLDLNELKSEISKLPGKYGFDMWTFYSPDLKEMLVPNKGFYTICSIYPVEKEHLFYKKGTEPEVMKLQLEAFIKQTENLTVEESGIGIFGRFTFYQEALSCFGFQDLEIWKIIFPCIIQRLSFVIWSKVNLQKTRDNRFTQTESNKIDGVDMYLDMTGMGLTTDLNRYLNLGIPVTKKWIKDNVKNPKTEQKPLFPDSCNQEFICLNCPGLDVKSVMASLEEEKKSFNTFVLTNSILNENILNAIKTMTPEEGDDVMNVFMRIPIKTKLPADHVANRIKLINTGVATFCAFLKINRSVPNKRLKITY